MQGNSNVTVSQSVKHVDALAVDSEVVDTWCAHSCMVGKHVACVFFNLSHETIFDLRARTQEVFNCCHHAVAQPRKRVATRGVCLLSRTYLNSNTSTAPIQSSSSSSWRLP